MARRLCVICCFLALVAVLRAAPVSKESSAMEAKEKSNTTVDNAYFYYGYGYSSFSYGYSGSFGYGYSAPMYFYYVPTYATYSYVWPTYSYYVPSYSYSWYSYPTYSYSWYSYPTYSYSWYSYPTYSYSWYSYPTYSYVWATYSYAWPTYSYSWYSYPTYSYSWYFYPTYSYVWATYSYAWPTYSYSWYSYPTYSYVWPTFYYAWPVYSYVWPTYSYVPFGYGSCSIWGDPHITGFDSAKTSLLEVENVGPIIIGFDEAKVSLLSVSDGHTKHPKHLKENFLSGDFWLVKSEPVSIQARYGSTSWDHQQSWMKAVAVGGPFTHGKTLTIEPMQGKVMWGQDEILSSLPSEFTEGRLINAKYYNDTSKKDKHNQPIPHLDVELPMGVKLSATRRLQYLDINITMPKLQSNQDGQCGNFNGDANDDSMHKISKRVDMHIAAEESLFP